VIRLGKLVAPLAVAALTAAAAGCGSGGGGAAAAHPPVVPGEATTGPDLSGVSLPNFVMPLIKGGVSRPRRALSPGNVVTTDTNAVCAMPSHGVRQPIAYPMATAVLRAYGYTTLSQQHKYILNYLVPIDLGGSTNEANVWPAAVKGTGFYEKIETDHVIRQLVCRRALSLRAAQQGLERDWYAMWLHYVVSTGRA
jgi:hypothetical protein